MLSIHLKNILEKCEIEWQHKMFRNQYDVLTNLKSCKHTNVHILSKQQEMIMTVEKMSLRHLTSSNELTGFV